MDTFVVRVWRATEHTGQEELRGTATQVATGRESRFADANGLVAFLLASTTPAHDRTAVEVPTADGGGGIDASRQLG